MTDLEAIKVRVSRRAYLDAPVGEQARGELIRLIEGINREAGLDFQWVNDGAAAFRGLRRSYGMFSGVRTLVALRAPKSLPDLMEKVGYYGERVVLRATALGLGSCWVGGMFDRNDPVLRVPDGSEMPCVLTVGPVKEALTGREKAIHALTHLRGKGRPVFAVDAPEPDWFVAGIEAAQAAPSAMNAREVWFSFLNDVASVDSPDKPSCRLIDLGIAKLHFELAAGGKFERGIGADLIRDS